MSLGGGGGARLVTRRRERTASAGAAGADRITGTLQRSHPCQCHRPSRGRASILPSKWRLFSRPPHPSVPRGATDGSWPASYRPRAPLGCHGDLPPAGTSGAGARVPDSPIGRRLRAQLRAGRFPPPPGCGTRCGALSQAEGGDRSRFPGPAPLPSPIIAKGRSC